MHASLALILTTAAVAFAQTSSAPGASPTDGISPCVLQCLTTAAATGGCSSFTDTSCVCTSTSFQTAVAGCLQQNCTAADLAAALALQQQNCGGAASGSSGASSAASTSTSTTVAISVSTTTSGAATGSATTAAGTGSTSAAGSGAGTGSSSSTRPVTSGASTSGASTSSSAGSQSSSPSSGEKVALFGRGGLVAGVVAVGGAVVGGLLL